MSIQRSRSFPCFLSRSLYAVSVLAILAGAPASAQTIVTAVNGEPITTFDIDEHAKLLKLLHKSASRGDALEDAVADRLKYDEAQKWGIDASDSNMQTALAIFATDAKLQPEAVLKASQQAKIDPDTIKFHLRASASWDAYVRSRNKTLGVSEEEISARLAKSGGAAKITDYDLRQVVFVVPANASPAAVESRMKEAQALRTRFVDCGTGLQLAHGLPDVAVKERMNRSSDSLSVGLRTLLAATQSGHLTVPQRTVTGIEMVAVCNRTEDSDQTTLRDRVQAEVLDFKLQAESTRMYKALRATAVVGKT